MHPHLAAIFHAALDAAQPERCLGSSLPAPAPGHNWVAGAGKAAASMSRALVDSGFPVTAGRAVTPYGHGYPGNVTAPVVVEEAAHPLPDDAGKAAAMRILELATRAGEDDLFVFLASGGGSSLLSCPPPQLALPAIRSLHANLLHSGASVEEINTVRRKLNLLAGGRLAIAAWPARVAVLAVSDVAGDDPAVIASGPCHPDPDGLSDALDVLQRWSVDPEPQISQYLADPRHESPDPAHPVFDTLECSVVANPAAMIEAACQEAARRGYRVENLGADLGGPARDLGARHAAQAAAAKEQGLPTALISGGETSVRVENPNGRGGRNSEYLLAFALAVGELQDIRALAADTDGIDGTGSNAGVFFDDQTLERARSHGTDPDLALRKNCSLDVFESSGDLLRTGPTRTNVNDLRVILINPVVH